MLKRIVLGAAVAALAAAPALVAVAPAEAATPTATGSYDCQLSGTGSASVQATVQLASLPSQAAPGQKVRASGTVSLTFNQGQSILTDLLLAQHTWITALDFPLTATAAGASTTLPPESVTSEKTATATPLTVPVTVSWPAYSIPARGSEVDLALPATNTIKDPLDAISAIGVPAEVAFSAVVDTDGLAPQRTMVCWVPDDGQPPPLARILVTAPAHAAAATPVPSVTAAPLAQAPAPLAGAAAPLGGATITTSAATTGAVPVSRPDSAAGATTAATSPAPVFAAVPASTRTDTVFIPEWALVAVGLLLVVALVAYDLLLHRRMAAMRRRIAQERSTP